MTDAGLNSIAICCILDFKEYPLYNYIQNLSVENKILLKEYKIHQTDTRFPLVHYLYSLEECFLSKSLSSCKPIWTTNEHKRLKFLIENFIIQCKAHDLSLKETKKYLSNIGYLTFNNLRYSIPHIIEVLNDTKTFYTLFYDEPYMWYSKILHFDKVLGIKNFCRAFKHILEAFIVMSFKNSFNTYYIGTDSSEELHYPLRNCDADVFYIKFKDDVFPFCYESFKDCYFSSILNVLNYGKLKVDYTRLLNSTFNDLDRIIASVKPFKSYSKNGNKVYNIYKNIGEIL